MKISDEISLSARNLLRRKGRTALTLVGVVIGTCMVVLMISLGIAQNQANDEMIQSWGDLTQIEIYGGGISVGSDGKPIKLDDAALTQIRELGHVLAATPFTNPYNLNGTITAGRNNRYVTNIGMVGHKCYQCAIQKNPGFGVRVHGLQFLRQPTQRKQPQALPLAGRDGLQRQRAASVCGC